MSRPLSQPRSGTLASQSQAGPSQPSQRVARPECEVCGVRKFRKDASTGLINCINGHVLQGFREETADDDDFNPAGMRKRGTGTGRKRPKKRRYRLQSGVWHGERGQFALYQCLQLLLRWQLAALHHEWPDLPDVVEPIARDLWALYVSCLPKLRPAPFLEQERRAKEQESGQTIEDLAELSAKERQDDEARRAFRRRMREVTDGSDFDSDTTSSSSSSTSDDRENVERPSPSRAKRDRTPGTGKHSTRGRWNEGVQAVSAESPKSSAAEKRRGDLYGQVADDSLPQLAPSAQDSRARLRAQEVSERDQSLRTMVNPTMSTLAIVYLALITARVPVLWADLIALVEQRRLPYLDALHTLPPDIVAPLPGRAIKALEPRHVPTIEELSKRACNIAEALNIDFCVTFPQLNAAPVLWRCVDHLLLPPTFYTAAKSLVHLVGIEMLAVGRDASELGTSERNSEFQSTERIGFAFQRSWLPMSPETLRATSPCMLLMAAVVIVIKLRYGLDGYTRTETEDGPKNCETAAPNILRWLTLLEESDVRAQSHISSAHNVDLDIIDLDDAGVDSFLDFAEESLLLPNHPNNLWWRQVKDVDDIFSFAPVQGQDAQSRDRATSETEAHAPSPSQVREQALTQARSKLWSSVPVSDSASRPSARAARSSKPLECGSSYYLFRGMTLGELPESAQRVLVAASSIVACDTLKMLEVVAELERVLVVALLQRRRLWSRVKRRRQKRREERRRERETEGSVQSERSEEEDEDEDEEQESEGEEEEEESDVEMS
ncbi:hypothetical protein IE81DRAFT_323916 [Ceraceosorus guamensis]|uniref:RRN7-type domain-containing protein n=1 Tax=Ceraceosorus guamensis TaxID=1522189 RepID=A0A316VX97_9BASI|nr:hypothetical protein IE81DRAFT_323916 [Ceraceosorus guamensis]PWN42090.1 hypothetical protein IE81DRAFT_323916 [Ceraceosorus guamensis]